MLAVYINNRKNLFHMDLLHRGNTDDLEDFPESQRKNYSMALQPVGLRPSRLVQTADAVWLESEHYKETSER
jgi:hypothetical protein